MDTIYMDSVETPIKSKLYQNDGYTEMNGSQLNSTYIAFKATKR